MFTQLEIVGSTGGGGVRVLLIDSREAAQQQERWGPYIVADHGGLPAEVLEWLVSEWLPGRRDGDGGGGGKKRRANGS
uniref:Uncharacterized protein n=1 Tax=Knipowitschia caucasica TaxID=637954 RepID=A0AAV2LQG5_KNICA